MKAVQLDNDTLITKLLSANLHSNFSGESGQMYELADSYQRNAITGKFESVTSEFKIQQLVTDWLTFHTQGFYLNKFLTKQGVT